MRRDVLSELVEGLASGRPGRCRNRGRRVRHGRADNPPRPRSARRARRGATGAGRRSESADARRGAAVRDGARSRSWTASGGSPRRWPNSSPTARAVALDSGTTVAQTARALAGRRLTVMPLSLHAAMALAESASVRLMLPGGEARPGGAGHGGGRWPWPGSGPLRFDTVVPGLLRGVVGRPRDGPRPGLTPRSSRRCWPRAGRSVLAVDGAKFGRGSAGGGLRAGRVRRGRHRRQRSGAGPGGAAGRGGWRCTVSDPKPQTTMAAGRSVRWPADRRHHGVRRPRTAVRVLDRPTFLTSRPHLGLTDGTLGVSRCWAPRSAR